jgi:hypothetical protein
MRRKFTAKPGKIESSIDLPHQMILGDRIVEMKLVEQLTWSPFRRPDHRSTPPRFASTQRNHASSPASTDFRNKIGPLLTLIESPRCSRRMNNRAPPIRGGRKVVRSKMRKWARNLYTALAATRLLSRRAQAAGLI